MSQDETEKKILEAFTGLDNLWRTPGGVSRETGIPVDVVNSYIIRNPGTFVQSTLTVSGSPIFGLRDQVEKAN